MSSLGNIVKKEARELMTPATFVLIIIIAILFGSLGGAIGSGAMILIKPRVTEYLSKKQE